MKRGAAGIVTDGGFRDSPDIARLDFPVYHQRPSPPTNITRHHAVDLDVPIACGDVAVFPGDIIVGDQEGVIVIPAHLAEEVAAEAAEMTLFEEFVLEQVTNGSSIYGLYPATDERTVTAFAEWRKAAGAVIDRARPRRRRARCTQFQKSQRSGRRDSVLARGGLRLPPCGGDSGAWRAFQRA